MALKPVGQDNLDHFEEDEEGRLYWRGALIVMEQRLIVPDAVNYSVIAQRLLPALRLRLAWFLTFGPLTAALSYPLGARLRGRL